MLQAPVPGTNGVPNPSVGAGDGRGHAMGMSPMEMMPMDGSQAAAAGQQMMPGQPMPGVPPGGEYWQAQAPHGQPAPHVVGNSELWMVRRRRNLFLIEMVTVCCSSAVRSGGFGV